MSLVIQCIKMAQIIVGQSSRFSIYREIVFSYVHVFIFSAAQKSFLRNM